MTHDDRRAARERCDKATPGPWENMAGSVGRVIAVQDPDGGCHPEPGLVAQCAFDDVDFIAYSRADLPAALDALDESDRVMKDLVDQADDIAAVLEMDPAWTDTECPEQFAQLVLFKDAIAAARKRLEG